jgi:hypothetical protein
MLKRIQKIFLTTSVIVIVAIVALFIVSSVTKAESNSANMPMDEISKVYKQALRSPLDNAISEVKDPELAQFSKKLLQSYELNNSNVGSKTEEASLANLVPDIKKINKVALNLPLQEAGKQIKDPELSDFYKSFVASIGADK